MRFQHLVDLGSKQQIGKSDDAGADPRRSISAAGAHGSNAVDEFGLANRRELRISVRAIHGIALQKDRSADVVAA